MAIGFGAIGTQSNGTATFSPALPAHATGNMLLCLVWCKPFDGTITVPTAGWAKIGATYTSGAVAAGVDVGSTEVQAFWKEAASGAETNPAVTEGATAWNVCQAINIVLTKGGTDTWHTPANCGGGMTPAAATFNITTDANPGITTDDYIVTFGGFSGNNSVPMAVHILQTATGVTFTNTHRVDATSGADPSTTTGGDIGACINTATVSGTASAAPVVTGDFLGAITNEAAVQVIRFRITPGAAPSTKVYPLIVGL